MMKSGTKSVLARRQIRVVRAASIFVLIAGALFFTLNIFTSTKVTAQGQTENRAAAPQSAVSFDGTPYTQDFQSISNTSLTPSSIASTSMLEVSTQSGGGSVSGWYIYSQSGAGRWGRTDGSSNTGSFFGMYDSSGNRALGSLGSASFVGYFGLVLQNTSGATISSVKITYDAMMNRNPNTTANAYPFSYRISNSSPITVSSSSDGTFSDSAGSWTADSNLSFTTPLTGIGAPNATQAAISPMFRIGGAAKTGTLSGLNWQAGQYLFIRWKETDETANDATAGVDNFKIENVVTNTAPTISESTASPYIDLPATGSGTLSGVISDTADPGMTVGVDFTVGDAESAADALSVTAVSSDQTVVKDSDLVISGTGANRNLKITPAGVGYSVITVKVTDPGALTATYTISYAASTPVANTATTRWLTGASDASTALAIDGDYMFVGDDEDQTLRLYDRNASGLPVASFDVTSDLALTDINGGVPREVDIEASARTDSTIYWLGSHSNASDGSDRPDRSRLFSTTVTTGGAASSLAFGGYYSGLKTDLIAWDNANGHGLGAGALGLQASSATGVAPEMLDGSGFNIEGLEFSPDNTALYICFRAPLEPIASRTNAMIVPVTNAAALVSGSPGVGPATFGTPIFLDLGGRGIREMRKNASNEYVIIAGSPGSNGDFRVYLWTGDPADQPQIKTANLADLNPEAVADIPAGLGSLAPESAVNIQFISDNGDDVYYGDGIAAKDLTNDNLKKFRTDTVVVGLGPTAANVSLSGRLQTSDGLSAGVAAVTLTAADGTVRKAISNPFGYFTIDNIESGQTYLITVSSRRFTFASRFVAVSDQISDLVLTAD